MTNRIKGLGLIDRVLEEQWIEVPSIVQDVVIKTTPKKKNAKRAKWLFEEVLHILEKRTEEKGKREKERYIYLNAEFQRITRKDRKAC